MYEKGKELASLSLQVWVSDEVFSLGWFVEAGVIIAAYAVWLKLVDKRRGTSLLLIGSLEAVAKALLVLILGNDLGLFVYTIRLFPVTAPLYATSITLSPILVMLVTQYTSSWKGYIVWTVIGNAFLNFVIFPLYTLVGILEFHNWNVFYHFLVLEAVTLVVRAVFLWITGTEKKLNRAV